MGAKLWKVRVCFPGAIIHLASHTEPVVQLRDGRVAGVTMALATDVDYGDTVGFIDWAATLAVTWQPYNPESS